MKVFISWSGKLSEDVALLLSEWLPSAVPGTKTWLSKKDIDKGAIWFGDIEKELKDTSVGIICLTRENMNRPWILFEAGGLNKGLDKSRVCPLLLDLDDKELDPPLKAFNATKPNKKDMLVLCKTINRQNTGNDFPDPQLEKFFNKFWRDFESKFAALLKKHGKSKPAKKKEMPEMIEEILETVQALQRASQSGLLLGDFVKATVTVPQYQGFVGRYDPYLTEPYSTDVRVTPLIPAEIPDNLKPKLSPGEILRRVTPPKVLPKPPGV